MKYNFGRCGIGILARSHMKEVDGKIEFIGGNYTPQEKEQLIKEALAEKGEPLSEEEKKYNQIIENAFKAIGLDV